MNLPIFAQIMKIDNFYTKIAENSQVKIRNVMNE